MSQILIQQYLNDLSDLRKFSGSTRESVVREAFKTLLNLEIFIVQVAIRLTVL